MYRTYVILTDEQNDRLDSHCTRTGSNKSEAIRRAVEGFLAPKPEPARTVLLREILERAGVSKWAGFRESDYDSHRVDISFQLGDLQFALRATSHHIELVRLEGFDSLLIAEADATDPDCVRSLVDAIERRNTR